jgi:hypothetical protein
VTTLDHAPPDWKVTTGYRILLAAGWAALLLACSGALLAVLLRVPVAWWLAVGSALLAIGAAAFLPEPVPAEMITGNRNHIASRDEL